MSAPGKAGATPPVAVRLRSSVRRLVASVAWPLATVVACRRFQYFPITLIGRAGGRSHPWHTLCLI